MAESFLTLNGVMITEDDGVEIRDVKRRFILKRKQWNSHSNAVFEAILRSSSNIKSKNLFRNINIYFLGSFAYHCFRQDLS